MASLRVDISGVRFRALDGELKKGDQLEIIRRRLSNSSALGMRAGDDPARLAEISAMRRPEEIKITEVAAVAVKGEVILPETVRIPAGGFNMGGEENKDEKPARTVTVNEFGLGKYPVTNAEYRVFLMATGQELPEAVADPALAKHPAGNVSWNNAAAYCEWLGKETGRKFRLPTEAEWEYAARGTDGREYPWGNKFDLSKITFNPGTSPVDAHPEGISPFGIMDMVGSVLEWVADWYGFYLADQVDNPKGPETGGSKVLRGGSTFSTSPETFRCASRCNADPDQSSPWFGFRVAENTQ